MVLASESQHVGSRFLVVDEKRMMRGRWLWLELCILFSSSFTVVILLQEGQLMPLTQMVVFLNV